MTKGAQVESLVAFYIDIINERTLGERRSKDLQITFRLQSGVGG